MTSNLAALLDGEYVPINDCDWVKYSPCGCPTGVLMARYAATEDAAWIEFYDLKRDRDKAHKSGVRFELMSHKRYSAEVYPLMASNAPCPHKHEEPS